MKAEDARLRTALAEIRDLVFDGDDRHRAMAGAMRIIAIRALDDDETNHTADSQMNGE